MLYKTSLKRKTWSFRNLINVTVVIVQRQDYLQKMNDILSDQEKFSTISLKDDTLLNFAVNQEKHVDKILKNLLSLKVWQEKLGNP